MDTGKTRFEGIDLICFSHLRWDFVYQRPQHLMSRMAKLFRTFYVEEPIFHNVEDDYDIRLTGKNVWVITPRLNKSSVQPDTVPARQKRIIDTLCHDQGIDSYIAWYYTPMAIKFTTHLCPKTIIYDCMDELSAFKFAPAELKLLETELMTKAQVVFTGGNSLYQAKKNAHDNIYAFPSGIDREHFLRSRHKLAELPDQKMISHLRFGFYGVIDERFDIELIREVAEKRPEWQLILIGPVVKINAEDLPRRDNIHYLGAKTYSELPFYLAGWDFAMIPFAKNESTRFISPTKTPEYLAGGKPVISTSITDVVFPFGEKKLVYIADNADQFIQAAETEIKKTPAEVKQWLDQVDAFLENVSWDQTASEMIDKIDACMAQTGLQTPVHKQKIVA